MTTLDSLITDGFSQEALRCYDNGRSASKQQDYTTAIQYYTEALSIPDIQPALQARVLEYRGEAYWLLKKFEQARADYQSALEASNEPKQQARALVRLAEVEDFSGIYDKSTDLYQQALKAGLENNHLWVIGRARRGLGILARRQGNTEQAVKQLTQALVAFRQIGDAHEQARVLTSLGRSHHARGEYPAALSAHQEALTIFESLQDKWRVVQCLSDLGETHQALYNVEVALQYHQKALVLAEEYGADLLKPEIYRNLGIDHLEMGLLQDGLAFLQKALTGAVTVSNYEQQALSLYHLILAYIRNNYPDRAAQAALELEKTANQLDADRYRALAAFARGEWLFFQGDQAAAIQEMNTAMLAAQSSVDIGILWKLHATMSHVVDDEGLAAVHRNIAAEFIRQVAEPLQDPAIKANFVNAPPVLAVLQAVGIDPNKL